MTLKAIPTAILALIGFGLILWPELPDNPQPDPEPQPIVESDVLDKADAAYRQELARLVLKHSGGDWTVETKKQWVEDVEKARAKTHSEVADRLAKAFAEGSAAGLIEGIRNGVWQ